MVLEWGSVQGQRVDSCLTPGSKLRSHTDWPSKRLGWKAAPMWRTAGKENSSAAWLSVRFDSDGVSLPGCLGQSSFLCLYLVLGLGVLPGSVCISQPWWIPEWGFLGGWQDILWAGISSLLLAPPEFSSVFRGSTNIFYQDLLLWDNSCKWLLSCLAKPGGFGWQFPRTHVFHSYLWLSEIVWPPHVKSWLIGKDPDAGRDWGQEEKGTTEDEMAGWHHWLDGREFEWTPGVGDGQGGLACRDSWGRKESDTTERLNWTELNVLFSVYMYIHHIFLNQSSVDGHFSYFHVFSVVNSAAVNIGVDLPFQIRVLSFLDICPGVGLVDHPVALLLVFWETSTLHHTFP